MPGTRPWRVIPVRALLLCTGLWVTASAVQQITFCMVTAARPGGVSYLERVVATYTAQNVHRMDGVGLLIMDVDGGTRGEAQRGRPEGNGLTGRQLAECTGPDVEGLPSCQVRQRTLDITAALSQCQEVTSGWVVLVEDDCEPCLGALDESLTALAGLDPGATSMAKLSRNMCATAFPVPRVSAYVQATRRRIHTHPHDIILAEEWAPAPARVYAHPRNLFHHIGDISTEQSKNDPAWQALYRDLRADTCFERNPASLVAT